jgi:hypothetical protein
MSGSATCKHCKRPIVWAITSWGNNMCVDPNPRPKGEYVLEATGVVDNRVVFAVRRARADDPPETRRACHFDTCPGMRRAAKNERGDGT